MNLDSIEREKLGSSKQASKNSSPESSHSHHQQQPHNHDHHESDSRSMISGDSSIVVSDPVTGLQDPVVVTDPITPATPLYHISHSSPIANSTTTSTTTLNTVITATTTPSYHPPYPVLAHTPRIEPLTASHIAGPFDNFSNSSNGSSISGVNQSINNSNLQNQHLEHYNNSNENSTMYNPHRLSSSISMPNLHAHNNSKRPYFEAFQPYHPVEAVPPLPTASPQFYADHQPVMISSGGTILVPANTAQPHHHFQFFTSHQPPTHPSIQSHTPIQYIQAIPSISQTAFQPVRQIQHTQQVQPTFTPTQIQFPHQPQHTTPIQSHVLGSSSSTSSNVNSPSVPQYQFQSQFQTQPIQNQAIQFAQPSYPTHQQLQQQQSQPQQQQPAISSSSKGFMSQIQFPQPTQFIQFVPPKAADNSGQSSVSLNMNSSTSTNSNANANLNTVTNASPNTNVNSNINMNMSIPNTSQTSISQKTLPTNSNIQQHAFNNQSFAFFQAQPTMQNQTQIQSQAQGQNQFPGQGQFMMQMRVGSQFQVQTPDSFALFQQQESKKASSKKNNSNSSNNANSSSASINSSIGDNDSNSGGVGGNAEPRPHKKRYVGQNPRRVVSVPLLNFGLESKNKKEKDKEKEKSVGPGTPVSKTVGNGSTSNDKNSNKNFSGNDKNQDSGISGEQETPMTPKARNFGTNDQQDTNTNSKIDNNMNKNKNHETTQAVEEQVPVISNSSVDNSFAQPSKLQGNKNSSKPSDFNESSYSNTGDNFEVTNVENLTSTFHSSNATDMFMFPSSSLTSTSTSITSISSTTANATSSAANAASQVTEARHKRKHSKTESFCAFPSTPSQFNYHEYLNLFTPSPSSTVTKRGSIGNDNTSNISHTSNTSNTSNMSNTSNVSSTSNDNTSYSSGIDSNAGQQNFPGKMVGSRYSSHNDNNFAPLSSAYIVEEGGSQNHQQHPGHHHQYQQPQQDQQLQAGAGGYCGEDYGVDDGEYQVGDSFGGRSDDFFAMLSSAVEQEEFASKGFENERVYGNNKAFESQQGSSAADGTSNQNDQSEGAKLSSGFRYMPM